MKSKEIFRKIAVTVSVIVGTSKAFVFALIVIIMWAFTGPIFHFSDTWQLVINTATTIITFLMVFLIQNTQNRDSKAIHIKLDELIKNIRGARNEMVNLEELPDNEIDELHDQFRELHDKYSKEVERRNKKKGVTINKIKAS